QRRPAHGVGQPAALLQRADQRLAQQDEADAGGDDGGQRQRDQRRLLGVEQRAAADLQGLQDQDAEGDHDGQGQRRDEQPLAVPFGQRLALLRRGGGRLPAAELAGPGDRRQRQHQHAVADVAQPVAGQEAERDQAPEGGVAEALGVVPVGGAQHREGPEHEARQDVDGGELDHAAARRRIARSKKISRAAWITKASTAVGIAQTDRWIGSMVMPLVARKPTISRIEPMAMKMSSPKNRPMLSVAAAMARTSWRVAASSVTPRASTAPSAIGATIGRIDWVWPAMEVRPSAEVSWRKTR